MGYPQKCDNLDVLISTTGKHRDLTHKFCENPDLICSSQSLEKGHYFWVDSSIPTDVSEPRSGGRGILKQHVFGKFGNGHKYVEICGNVHIHIHIHIYIYNIYIYILILIFIFIYTSFV